MADVQPMQIDPPGSGRNLAVAPCSTAAPAHHAAVAFVQPAARRSPRLRQSDCYGIISHADVHDPPGSSCTPAASPPVARPDAPADHAAAASVSSAAACPVLAVAFPATSPPVASPAAPTLLLVSRVRLGARLFVIGLNPNDVDHLRQLRPSEVLGIWEHGYNQITEMWEPELAAAYAAERVASRRAAEAKGRKRKRPAGA